MSHSSFRDKDFAVVVVVLACKDTRLDEVGLSYEFEKRSSEHRFVRVGFGCSPEIWFLYPTELFSALRTRKAEIVSVVFATTSSSCIDQVECLVYP